MAGDWIKMRTNLRKHPKVALIASALRADRLLREGALHADKQRVVGVLLEVWGLFDEHSLDGELVGYSTEQLDEEVRWEGFTRAMADVGWCEILKHSIRLPEFDTHNGASAKRRAQESERKRAVRNASASDADKTRTKSGPEKRREEKSSKAKSKSKALLSADADERTPFDRFYGAYPKKETRKESEALWKAKNLDAIATKIIDDVLDRTKRHGQWQDRQFIPQPVKYLRRELWNDEIDITPRGSHKPDPHGGKLTQAARALFNPNPSNLLLEHDS